MKKRFIVTGASGFLGSHVSDYLTKKGFNVLLFDKKKSPYLQKKQKMIIGDITNTKHLNKAFRNIDIVFHFAGTADLEEANKKPFTTIENNILSVVKILKSALKNKVKKIVFASSIYARSEQGGVYSTSKLSAEMIIERICKRFNLKYVILRFGTVYGERANKFNTVQKMINNAKRNSKIYRNTKGNEIRSYIHVRDVAKIVYNSTSKKFENGHYNIFGEKKTTVKNLLNLIKSKIPKLKILFSSVDKRKYNYKVNPFTYKLRKGKNLRLDRYISLKKGVIKLIST